MRLWRVFAHKSQGFYVDVGAGDPAVHSVTKLFYDAGWNGINIEPGPLHSQLLEERPRDVNLRVAVTTEPGERDFWVSEPDTGLSAFEPPATHLLPEGFTFTHTRIRCERLETVLDDYARGRDIDFLKVDVEGAERDVLASFDLSIVRPTVVLVESISPLDNWPSHDEWEPLLVEHGYVFAAFDGINRFYVPLEHHELVDVLSYPMSVLDRYEPVDAVTHRVRDHQALAERASLLEQELEAQEHRVHQLESGRARLVQQGAGGGYALAAAMEQSLSWRITRPLRAVRRFQLARRHPTTRAARVSPTRSPESHELEAAFARRTAQAIEVLDPTSGLGQDADLEEALVALTSTLTRVAGNDLAKAWLSLVTVDGSYPGERSVGRLARLLRMEGAEAVRVDLLARYEDAVRSGRATTAGLDVRYDAVVVDVTHTVSYGLHTGIQRVVRETVGRWLNDGRSLDLAFFDFERRSLQRLSQEEHARLQGWRAHISTEVDPAVPRHPESASDDVLVPWGCRLVLPELAGEARRCSAYRALVTASVARSLSLVGYDVIPVVAAETVTEVMTASFVHYLSMVKYAARISTISEASADSFRGFAQMAASAGLRSPKVAAHALPTEAPQLTPDALAEARLTLGFDDRPTVLVVGSHEPRKNHLAIIEAAERLWTAGHHFRLLFIGGSSWKSEAFDELVAVHVARGRPIVVRRQTTEDELWASYRFARFTIFASLIEGYGLPVAESLASGTPAITSAYGSMAEIARGGGCLAVDPRDVDDVERAIEQLLQDDALLARLRDEARRRPVHTWDAYADEVWQFLADATTS